MTGHQKKRKSSDFVHKLQISGSEPFLTIKLEREKFFNLQAHFLFFPHNSITQEAVRQERANHHHGIHHVIYYSDINILVVSEKNFRVGCFAN